MKEEPSALSGLRHIALRVRDIQRAKAFYISFIGMQIVWEPDSENCYLSSGVDNLALHEDKNLQQEHSALDHFGFIASSPALVDAWAAKARQQGVKITKHPKQHRDGSYSCYIEDPEGNVVQILYEPTISPQQFSGPKTSG